MTVVISVDVEVKVPVHGSVVVVLVLLQYNLKDLEWYNLTELKSSSKEYTYPSKSSLTVVPSGSVTLIGSVPQETAFE